MIIEITKRLRDKLLGFNPVYRDGFYIAKKTDKGVLYKSDTDYQFLSMDDRLGNYFYLRYIDDEEVSYNVSDRRFSSCSQNSEVNIPLRLFSVVEDISNTGQINTYTIDQMIKSSLMRLDLRGYQNRETNIRIELRGSTADPITILKDELGINRHHKNNYIFNVVDFDLKYTYSELSIPAPLEAIIEGDAGAICDTFTFTQPTPAALWTINHMLGKHPDVTILDDAGNEVEACIMYVNDNTIEILFNPPLAGSAKLN